MKKKIVLLMAIIVLGMTGILMYKTINTANKKKLSKELLSSMPKIPLFELSSNTYVFKKLNRDKPTIIIYFDPWCEYCQYEAKVIRENIEKFDHAEIVMISDESTSNIKEFANEYDLKNYPQVSFYKIQSDQVLTTFGQYSVPTILIYNKEGDLVQRFDGETKIEAILNHI